MEDMVHQSQKESILKICTENGVFALLVSKWPISSSEVLKMILALPVRHRYTFCTWILVRIIYDAWIYTERMQCAIGNCQLKESPCPITILPF